MATFRNESFAAVVTAGLKQTATVLRDNDIPFCLIGSLSAWVRGGPESSHDLDFGIKEEDVMRAAHALEDAGFTMQVPPEDWLVKAWTGEPAAKGSVLIDLIYAPSGVPITDEVIARADIMDVLAHRMPVLNATDLMVMKLMSLREQHLTLQSSIATARSIREQIDWDDLRERTKTSPYARGFFTMCEGLSICPPEGQGGVENNILADMQKGARQPSHERRRELTEYLRSRHGDAQ